MKVAGIVVQCDSNFSLWTSRTVKVFQRFVQIRCLLLCGYLAASLALLDMQVCVIT